MNKTTRIYLIINLIGICLFLLIDVGIIRAIHSEHRDAPDFGDSLNFLMMAAPVVLVCFVYSIIWGLKSILKRNYQGSLALLFVATAWGVIILLLRMYQ
jgi:hypothetical protein